MRAFIAIALSLQTKNAVSKIQEILKSGLPKISWTKPDNLHITLKFLGEISSEQAENIKQIITEIAKTTNEFRIKLVNLGVFPNLAQARIIWIGDNKTRLALKQIVEQLELKLAAIGMLKETRIFSNHLTLGRIKNKINSFKLKEILDKTQLELASEKIEFNARAITLFKSNLEKTGPTYTVLAEANLRIT